MSYKRNLLPAALKVILEVFSALCVLATIYIIIRYYNKLPSQVYDILKFNKNQTAMISKKYIIFAGIMQLVVYGILFFFQTHPQWRAYSSKLYPKIKNETKRNILYQLNSWVELIVKTEISVLIFMAVYSIIYSKNLTLLFSIMFILIIITISFSYFRFRE